MGRVREERLRAWVEYQAALAPGGGGSSTAPVGSDTAAEGDNKNNSGNINDAGDDGEKRNGKSKSDKRDTDRGSYREYGGIGVLLLDVWGNQPWRLDKAGMATAKGDDQEGPGFHPKALLSKRRVTNACSTHFEVWPLLSVILVGNSVSAACLRKPVFQARGPRRSVFAC